jgi:hypothetical protein
MLLQRRNVTAETHYEKQAAKAQTTFGAQRLPGCDWSGTLNAKKKMNAAVLTHRFERRWWPS